jgi:RNA 3'-terminal phosphate cyclase (ATP)
MDSNMVELDGHFGGGQVLRTALTLSMITGRAFFLRRIRAARRLPGLQRQHLTAVLAATDICGATAEGAELGSESLAFQPGAIGAGEYRFDIGSAGSTTLVLQTLLPALLHAPGSSRVRICGGTHNPLAPPYEFIERSWLPLLRRMGAVANVQLLRHGFMPAGGGELEFTTQPSKLCPMELPDRGKQIGQWATVLLGQLPRRIADRELEQTRKRLKLAEEDLLCLELSNLSGPGNVLLLEYAYEQLTAIISAVGHPRVRAAAVADIAIEQARTWLSSSAAVTEYLADQLLVPIALAGRGSFTCTHLSAHMESSFAVIEGFLPVRFTAHALGDALVQVACAPHIPGGLA